jgi:subtilisin family serine protease
MKSIITTCLVVALFASFVLCTHPKVDVKLLKDFSFQPKNDLIILMKETTDLNKIQDTDGKFLNEIPDMDRRARLIVTKLMRTAYFSQQHVIEILKRRNVQYESLWINNVISVKQATIELAEEIAKRAEVEKVASNNEVIVDVPVDIQEASNIVTDEPQWNLKWINVDKVWAAGHTGKGVVLSVSDTGVRHTHEALRENYRGRNSDGTYDHNYNWFDPSGSREPIDRDGHGTHTMATAAGRTQGIGIAPDAKWVACRGLASGTTSILKCIQWLLAPTDLAGKNPNPDLRPHVSSHSYWCSNCRVEDAVDALVKAGVMFIKSAGNNGPRCSSITEPGTYENAIAVAALDKQSDKAAYFSSRGPVKSGSKVLLKPNVAAPGTNVYSAVGSGDNKYSTMSGTSMAAPHLNGVVGLLWSAVPRLARKIPETLEIIYKTAKHQTSTECDSKGQSPNYTFGYGTIDVYAAYNLAKQMGY